MKIRKLLLTLISVSLLTTSVFAYGHCDITAYEAAMRDNLDEAQAAFDEAQATLDAAQITFDAVQAVLDAARIKGTIFISSEALETLAEAAKALTEATIRLYRLL